MAKPQQGGWVKGRETTHGTVRVRMVGGYLTGVQAQRIGEVAARFGDGHMHVTTRQGIELPGVPAEQADAARAELEAVGLTVGSTGPTVRSIVGCAGDSCRHALLDSQALAQRIDRRLADLEPLPHKFKIGITGCPNSCAKPRENDLGIMGCVEVELDEALCNGCGRCVKACPEAGALVCSEDGTPGLVGEFCSQCAYCVDNCPRDAWGITHQLFKVFVGGRMGRHPRLAAELPLRITSEAQLLEVVEAIVDWYAAHGSPKERFGETLERLGMQPLTQALELRPKALAS